MRKTPILAAAASALAAALLAGTTGSADAGTPAAAAKTAAKTTAKTTGHPPAAFAHPRQNPYYPLEPGTVSRLRGSDGAEKYLETVTVTHRHKVIQGVRTTVVKDVVRRADGSVSERTTDWYAPDNRGNVWYFGESTATYDPHGTVTSREGTWQAGVRGARRGVIMPAHPRPTDAYRQEFRAGHAEDQAWIVQRGLRLRVPYGTVRHALRTFEWTRLEPGVVSAKFYAPGLGIVKERDVAGGSEKFELVSVSHH